MKQLTTIFFFLIVVCRVNGQVNLQTGSATFSLPMFSWQDDKSRLNSMVALSYNSGNGLRVNDIASNAGQGWNMIAGGEIVRMQAGEPDDQVVRYGNGSEFDLTRYPSGILYASVPAANGCPIALTKYPIYRSQNQIYSQHNVIAEDKQLDFFSFQFNGKAGMFVLDPNNIGVGKLLGDSKIKITFQQDANLINQGIRTKITSFSIHDVDGLIYKFSLHGLTKVLKTEYSDENYNYKQSQPKFRNGKVFYQSAFDDGTLENPWIIGSWHLTEIEDALTHRKVFFNYVTRSISMNAGEDISYNETNKNYAIVTKRKSVTKVPELTSVSYPDGHQVAINYGKARIDVPGQEAISSVNISYQGRYLSKYELTTSYFILNRYGTPVSNYEKKVARLCLRSVRKIGVDLKEDTPPYLFDYYTGSSAADDFIPPPYTFAKDIWGFYNGANTEGYHGEIIPLTAELNTIKNSNQVKGLCYLREGVSGVNLNAKPGYAKNGLLRQIVYPTGGTLTYQYNQNTGLLNGSVRTVGGVHVNQTSSTDGGYSNGCGNPIITNYNYVMNGTGSNSSLWGLEMPVNSMVSHNHYQPEHKYYKRDLSCPFFGCCDWRYKYPGIISQQQAINPSTAQKILNTVSTIMGVVSILQTVNNILLIATASGGSILTLVIDGIVNLAILAVTCIGNQERNSTATTYFNSDMNAVAPLPVQFKRVEVVESPGTIGKTVQEFTSDEDYGIWVPANPAYSFKQRFAPWAYGLPKNTIVYDVNGNKIKETNNEYSFGEKSCYHSYAPIGDSSETPITEAEICPPKDKAALYIKSAKCLIRKSNSQRNTNWADINQYNNPSTYHLTSLYEMDIDIYDIYTGRVELKSTSEKIYKNGDPNNFLETKTQYFYNSIYNYEVNKVVSTQSNGDVNYKFIKYSSDFGGEPLTTLLQNNIVSLPVTTSIAVSKSGTGPLQYTGETVTEFVQLPNSDIKPLRSLQQRFEIPKPENEMLLYAGPNNTTSQYKIPQIFSYDGSGNLAGIKDEGGRTITNLYDYNDKYVVASIINADPLVDKTAYTSFETNSFGNWVPGGSIAYSTSNTSTGARSFVLSGGNSLSVSSLNTTRPYTVSFWSSSAGVSVSGGATLIKSAPTYNGTTYYEYDLPSGISSVTVSGSGIIDELRLFPKTARMRTTTYDPLIGKTSECDENNRITYYEYDNLGRLQFIKDEKKNIVKMHEYNNVSGAKQNGCPGIYYNHFISQVYTKDCGPGYQGSQVVYSVAANTYSSVLSQEEADAQAENNLLTNGQVYANGTGTCHLIYYNTAISGTDTTVNCPPGYIGGAVTYTVPAGRYTSILSQADADEKAMEELEANLAAWVNDPAHAVCISTVEPDWVWLEGSGSYCQKVNGVMHLFILETDINPNSSTINQTRWWDAGPDEAICPQPTGDCPACPEEGYGCPNGIDCEIGIRVNISTVEVFPNVWQCVYHYEFSDGSWSRNYFEYNSYPCAI